MNSVNKNTYNLSCLFLKSIWKGISLHEEIYAKYSLSNRYAISNGEIHYKKPDRFFPEIYRNVSIYLHFSLFFEERTNKKDFRFLFSPRVDVFKQNLQTMILKSGEVSGVNNLQTVGKLLHKNGPHSQFVDRLSSSTKLQRWESDTLLPSTVPLKSYYSADSQSNIVDSNEQHQKIKPTTDNKVHGADTRAITSFPVWSLPQSGQTITIAHEPATTSVVYRQSSILQEMASHSHDNIFISARTLLDQRWQTKMLTTATMLTTISENQIGTPTVGISQSVYFTGDTQPALREGPAPIIKQTHVEATTGTTTHFRTASITNATHPFTVICRAGRMEPPHLSYAFAQPRRPMAQEEHVVTKVHEKEVVKVVQKEVQSLMSSGSLVKYLSRADYTHIADNVYSSLARRLLVERERLGMR